MTRIMSNPGGVGKLGRMINDDAAEDGHDLGLLALGVSTVVVQGVWKRVTARSCTS